MRRAGLVVVNGVAVQAYFGRVRGAVRLRLAAADWDRLRLCEGQWVRVELPDEEPASLQLTVAFTVPPFVWLDLTAPAARPAQPAQLAG